MDSDNETKRKHISFFQPASLYQGDTQESVAVTLPPEEVESSEIDLPTLPTQEDALETELKITTQGRNPIMIADEFA